MHPKRRSTYWFGTNGLEFHVLYNHLWTLQIIKDRSRIESHQKRVWKGCPSPKKPRRQSRISVKSSWIWIIMFIFCFWRYHLRSWMEESEMSVPFCPIQSSPYFLGDFQSHGDSPTMLYFRDNPMKKWIVGLGVYPPLKPPYFLGHCPLRHRTSWICRPRLPQPPSAGSPRRRARRARRAETRPKRRGARGPGVSASVITHGTWGK